MNSVVRLTTIPIVLSKSEKRKFTVWQCIFTISKCYTYMLPVNSEYLLFKKVRIIHFLK